MHQVLRLSHPVVSASSSLPVTDDSSVYSDEWIPTREDVECMYLNLLQVVFNGFTCRNFAPASYDVQRQLGSTGGTKSVFRDIRSRKIGWRTFVEGHLDSILLLACWTARVRIVKCLLPKYTQYFSIDTLIDCYIPLRDGKVTRFKQLKYDKLSLLHAAAAGGLKVDVVKLLLRAGADVNNQSLWSVTPLLSALECPWLSPIVYAVQADVKRSNCTQTLACLIKSGANVNYRDADGLTPLMYAAKFCNGADSAKVLIKAGADRYAMDFEGFTALHHSCLSSCAEICKYLLEIAPDLLLLQGKAPLACPAPYLTIFGEHMYPADWCHKIASDLSYRRISIKSMFSFFSKHHITNDPLTKSILDNPNCPLAVKFDLNMLQIAYECFSHTDLSILLNIIQIVIDPTTEANGAAPILLPGDVVKEKVQLELLQHIKPMDPTSSEYHYTALFVNCHQLL